MKKHIILAFLTTAGLLSQVSYGVSMNFDGNFRTEADYYSKLAQDLPNTSPQKQFIRGRFLLDPNLVVDDHFSIKSQWSLLDSANVPSSAQPLGTGLGGFIYGDPNTKALVLNRAWLEWTSDFGVVRLGRMPVSWGYGLIWDAGTGIWDDYGTTYDRLEYRLHLGHVVGAVAYSKPRKESNLGGANDADLYAVYLQYDNPETDVEGGIYFEKQVHSSGQHNEIATTGNPQALPIGRANLPPLALKNQVPTYANVLDVYLKETVGYFNLGGEISWISGSATDYGNNLAANDLNAFGIDLNVAYEYHKIKTFLEFLYASGDNNLNDTHARGFSILNQNKQRAGMIFRELLGNYTANDAGTGSFLDYGRANGTQDSFSGVYYFRPGLRLDWSPSWASGVEAVIARKAAVQTGEDSNLGVEFDLGTDYSVYKNFDLGIKLGVLFPGNGIGVPQTHTIFGVGTTTSLKF